MDTLQDALLSELRRSQTNVFVFLINGIKLSGYIENFDRHILILQDRNRNASTIYKKAISTIVIADEAQTSAPPRGRGRANGSYSERNRRS